jgi:hypothetical protein
MKIKDLIEKLKEFPEDMEVVKDISSHMFYDTEIDSEVITVTVYPEDLNDPLMLMYYKKDLDDDLSWRRVKKDVLLLY